METQSSLAPDASFTSVKTAKALVAEQASNEIVFAVVGYVGSGTSEIATTLKGLLENPALPGGRYDVDILKARKVIEDWAAKSGEAVPATPQNDLATTTRFQDLGDKMRAGGDHAIVARRMVDLIRLTRATKLGISDPGEDPMPSRPTNTLCSCTASPPPWFGRPSKN